MNAVSASHDTHLLKIDNKVTIHSLVVTVQLNHDNQTGRLQQLSTEVNMQEKIAGDFDTTKLVSSQETFFLTWVAGVTGQQSSFCTQCFVVYDQRFVSYP